MASRCSQIASMCQFETNSVPGSRIGQASSTKAPKERRRRSARSSSRVGRSTVTPPPRRREPLRRAPQAGRVRARRAARDRAGGEATAGSRPTVAWALGSSPVREATALDPVEEGGAGPPVPGRPHVAPPPEVGVQARVRHRLVEGVVEDVVGTGGLGLAALQELVVGGLGDAGRLGRDPIGSTCLLRLDEPVVDLRSEGRGPPDLGPRVGIADANFFDPTTWPTADASAIVDIPAAVSVFPDEIYSPPRSWAEEAYPKLIHYNKLDKGGHFAAWEQPDLLSEEVRTGLRSLR